MEAPYEIWLWLALRFLRTRCLKSVDDERADDTRRRLAYPRSSPVSAKNDYYCPTYTLLCSCNCKGRFISNTEINLVRHLRNIRKSEKFWHTKNLGNWNPKILLSKDGNGKAKSLDLDWSDSMPLQGKALDIRLKIAWKYILPFFVWKVAPLHLSVLLLKVP